MPSDVVTYSLQVPPEPPVGTQVMDEYRNLWTRDDVGWRCRRSAATVWSWRTLLTSSSSLEDVTPPARVWDAPEEPPVGTKVKDHDGDIWERRESGWCTLPGTGVSLLDAEWRHVFFAYGPLTEIR